MRVTQKPEISARLLIPVFNINLLGNPEPFTDVIDVLISMLNLAEPIVRRLRIRKQLHPAGLLGELTQVDAPS